MPEGLSDEKTIQTIQTIQENPYMQYLLGLPKFTEKPVFVPELFVQIRKRLDHEFFNLLTLLLSEADGSKPKKVHTDEDGNDHGGGTMKVDATCCDAEVEATFGTSKRIYWANDIRAKLDDTADTWTGACFFAKNVMKFLRGLLCLIFAKLGLKAFKRRISYSIDYLMGVLDPTRGCLVKII